MLSKIFKVKFIACLVPFFTILIYANTAFSNPAKDKVTGYYLNSLATPYIMLLRIATGIYVEDASIDPDLRTTSFNNIKIPTKYGPIFIKEINQRDVVGPFQNTIKFTYELTGLSFKLDEEKLPIDVINVAELAKINSLEGNFVISVDYNVKNSDLSLSTHINLKDKLEIDASIDLLNVQSNADLFSSLLSGQLASGQGGNDFTISALLKRIAVTIKDDGFKEKYISYISTTEGKTPSVVRKELPDKIQKMLLQVFPETGDKVTDDIVKNNIRQVKKLVRRGGYLSLTIVPEEPVSLEEFPALINDKDFEFLAVNMKHTKNRMENLIFSDKKFLSGSESDERASFILAKKYLTGRGVPQNFEKGLKLLKAKKYENDPETNYLLGVVYSKGIATSADINKAYYHLLTSAALGHSEAIYVLNKLEQKMSIEDVRRIQDGLYDEWLDRKGLGKLISKAKTGDLGKIRKLAMYMKSGDKLPRNYFQSYVWSVIGAAMNDSLSENIRQSFWSAAGNDKYITLSDVSDAQKLATKIWIENIQKHAARE